MISIIITSFKEPNLENAINAIKNQKINYKHEIIVVAPDKEAEKLSKKYNIKYFKDEGKGKSYALNLLLKKLKSNILIFTDGDVYLGNNAINEIMELFKDEKIGVVSGRIISNNKKNNLFGYWSHLLADNGAHKIRKKLFNQGKFLECSGYLFAFRNNIIKEFPLDVAEDAIIPYMFYLKDYKIGYCEKALVYVKNPDNFKDWIKQRKRTAKAHETLKKYYPNFPRVKSFKNEIIFGTFWALSYPKTIKEMYWTILLFFARFYMWFLVLTESKILKKQYQDAWEKVNSKK
jgi:cellulose synthase/poly-beta-1,6-N-acetylglucosamine synthase-like glycosyltransferase